MTLDDNADFRQPEHADLVDIEPTDPLEARAKEKDLNYVKLDGEVGIIGNGAGLVMSTLDVVAYAGEGFGGVRPANFLDIGGGASAEVMANGLEIILSDPAVRSVFVNVFGGITACDAVANGIVPAFGHAGERGEHVTKPLVVRLDGNNAVEGRRILAEAALSAGRAGGHDGRRGPTGGRAGRGRGTDAMAIFLNETSRVIVQGMTGSEGTKHTRRMLASGTDSRRRRERRARPVRRSTSTGRTAGLRHGRGGDERDRRRRHRRVRAAAVRKGRRARRRSTPRCRLPW